MPLQTYDKRKLTVPVNSYQTRNHEVVNLPSPIGGLNFRAPISQQPELDAVVLENMLPRSFGLELRPGWRTVAEDYPDSVNSLASYIAADPLDNRLFAFVGGSVYDVNDPLDPGTPLAGATDGKWKWVNFVNDAGHFLVAVNNGAGYWTYDETGGWIKRVPTGVWPTSDKIVDVCVWKNRLWFCFDLTSDAYYLEVNAIAGDATLKTFGAQFRRGGNIVGMANWTLDAGTGIDDHQVIFGAGGDIVIYTGTDPDTVGEYNLKGVWNVGFFPVGHRFYTPYGGDIYMINDFGFTPLSKVIAGQVQGTSADIESISDKIRNRLSRQITQTRQSFAWQPFLSPEIDALILKEPVTDASVDVPQYVMDLASKSWCIFTNVPAECFINHEGKTYFGTADGRVCRAWDNTNDDVPITNEEPLGKLVQGNVQTAFNPYGSPADLTQFLMARPVLLAISTPSVQIQMNTEYTVAGTPGSPSYADQDTALWDIAKWDEAVWAGEQNTYAVWVGLTGIGYYGAIRISIRGPRGTTWASCHVMSQSGGVM